MKKFLIFAVIGVVVYFLIKKFTKKGSDEITDSQMEDAEAIGDSLLSDGTYDDLSGQPDWDE